MPAPLVDIHTHRPCSTGAICLRAYEPGRGETLPALPYSTGIHPWRAQQCELDATWQAELLESVTPLTKAIGETGLDYHSAREPQERRRQEEWLRWQAGEALRLGLPLVIHCVRAYEPLMAVLADYPVRAAIFHGFTGSPEVAAQLTRRGYFLSFGASLLRSPKTQQALREIPFEKLFLETDDAADVSLEMLYDTAASLKGCSAEQLRERIYENYLTLFPL